MFLFLVAYKSNRNQNNDVLIYKTQINRFHPTEVIYCFLQDGTGMALSLYRPVARNGIS